ncbi:MAG: bifunctional 23S rRNA (guanine(2069)-N(7))-methyltransferase RlmK/23S rRNA (guanine(2445)-N(2))-methyltransferase RlmL [Gammaproteobacteria bacterium]|nr:bifunctional 23S rRNA (guanine(2069)-N(7))-methyltransferase RlmK/23S rRNA (guanine(2445)-N(2))-methyltransferase RlmL [Gammaproteobacteria bacterium]
MSQFELFATTPKGMEPLLADELRTLGGRKVAQARGGVRFTGRLEEAYRACLWSRIAGRILMPVARFPAPDENALYTGVNAFPWEEHLDPQGTLAVDFTSTRSAITHTHYGALKVKDAVVDRFRARVGVRPSVDTRRPHLRINVHVANDEAVVSIDLSGDSLHRRGYREEGVAAPLKENLAAAILLRADWPALAHLGAPLLDPLCGSGTLPIEAALMAGDVAPGLTRTYFGFHHWRGHEAKLWQDLVDEAIERRERGLQDAPVIVGYDVNPQAVKAAIGNVNRADLRGIVHIERKALSEARPVGRSAGLVVANPPYGERIGADGGVMELYRELGDVLREHFQGWHAAVFTGAPELARHIGLRSRTTYTFFNGPIECKLFNYDITPEHAVERLTVRVPPAERARDLRPAEELGDGARGFENRLRKNLKHLGRWARREGVDAWRVYDADLPDYAFAVDIYQSDRLYVHVQEYEAPPNVDAEKVDQRAREALTVIPQVLEIPPAQMVFKIRRRQKGAAQYEKLGTDSGFHEVREGRARFLVNLGDYLDTGLFLDHRITRQMVGDRAADKRFLNLFAYTCTATVHAALGGARSTTSVDMSNTYLEWGERNLHLNGLGGSQHRFVQADCLAWLEEAAPRERGAYDLAFLDPPTFSNSKRMRGTFDVQRDHVEVIRQVMELLAPGGVLVFSTNFRKFRLDEDVLADFAVQDLNRTTLPPDFERNPRIHYCWQIQRR